MKLSKIHIYPVFNIGILLIGIFLYFGPPINMHSSHDSPDFCQQSDLLAHSDHKTADQNRGIKHFYGKAESGTCKCFSLSIYYLGNEELPVDNEYDSKNEKIEFSLKETEDSEESSAGMNSLATLKQVVTHSVLPFDVQSLDLLSLSKHLKFLPDKYSRLYEIRSPFSMNGNPSPLASGVAIHAP